MISYILNALWVALLVGLLLMASTPYEIGLMAIAIMVLNQQFVADIKNPSSDSASLLYFNINDCNLCWFYNLCTSYSL